MLAGIGPYRNISREIIFTDPAVKKKNNNNNRDHLLNIYYVTEKTILVMNAYYEIRALIPIWQMRNLRVNEGTLGFQPRAA